MEKITLEVAAERIDATPDHTATVVGDRVMVTRHGKASGYVSQEDLDQLRHTPTGWGKNLTRGAYPIWRAITGN